MVHYVVTAGAAEVYRIICHCIHCNYLHCSIMVHTTFIALCPYCIPFNIFTRGLLFTILQRVSWYTPHLYHSAQLCTLVYNTDEFTSIPWYVLITWSVYHTHTTCVPWFSALYPVHHDVTSSSLVYRTAPFSCASEIVVFNRTALL